MEKSDNFVIKAIVKQLVSARQARKLSQQSLAKNMLVPQSYLSKIEQGDIDIRTGKLVQLARLLGFELMLVPIQFVPTVTAIISPTPNWQGKEQEEPLYSLSNEENG
jgi:transcriptional regulator with XRE-family HTH domain